MICPYCHHADHTTECGEAVADGSGGHPCGCIPPPWYVAVRWPHNHIVMRLLFPGEIAAVDYEEIRERVLASVKEALVEMGIDVVEDLTS